MTTDDEITAAAEKLGLPLMPWQREVVLRLMNGDGCVMVYLPRTFGRRAISALVAELRKTND